MVGIGIVGIGFMGMIHYLAAKRSAGARVAAVCSRDAKKRAGDWSAIRGNFGPPGAMMDLSGIATYGDAQELIDDPNVGLVDLCVPTDEHANLAVKALESGKHVLVEKPIALDLADADRMLAAARASGKLLMVAHVLPFFPEFAFALEAVRSGIFGKIQAAHLSRVIARPDWSSGIAEVERSGGPAIDLHIHDTHYLALLCGPPRSVRSRGVSQQGAVTHLSNQYLFDDPNLAVSADSGALSMPGRPFAHGFELYLERGTLTFGFASVGDRPQANPLAVILENGSVDWPELGGGDPIDAFEAEIGAAIASIESNQVDSRLDAELARAALATCRAEVESVASGLEVPLA